MCAYVARRRRLLAEGVSIAELRGLNSRTRPTATFYGGILLLAALAPRAAAWGFRGRESPPPAVEAVGLFRRRPRNPVVHVGDPRFDDWEVVADYEDLETARAFRDRLREFGFGAELTADEALDEFRRGDIALRVPPDEYGDATWRLRGLTWPSSTPADRAAGPIAKEISASGRPRQAVRPRARNTEHVDPMVEGGDHDLEAPVPVEVADRGAAATPTPFALWPCPGRRTSWSRVPEADRTTSRPERAAVP